MCCHLKFCREMACHDHDDDVLPPRMMLLITTGVGLNRRAAGAMNGSLRVEGSTPLVNRASWDAACYITLIPPGRQGQGSGMLVLCRS